MTPPDSIQARAPRPLTLTDHARRRTQGLTAWLGARLHRAGVHPDTVSLLGLGLVLLAALLIASGRLTAAGVLLLVSLPLDAVDGAVARAMQRQDRVGALLDSTLDRYADAVIFGALGYHFAGQGRQDLLLLALLALVGSYGVSYVRARAEGLGVDCTVGLFTRLERLLVLLPMLLIEPLLLPGLVLLAVGTNVTVLQRVIFVMRELRQREG